MKVNKYSKLIAAVVGLLVLVLGPEFAGAAEFDAETVTKAVVALATAFGVYQLENTG
jgi:hypothetical protein